MAGNRLFVHRSVQQHSSEQYQTDQKKCDCVLPVAFGVNLVTKRDPEIPPWFSKWNLRQIASAMTTNDGFWFYILSAIWAFSKLSFIQNAEKPSDRA
jgi:hypothetical protein